MLEPVAFDEYPFLFQYLDNIGVGIPDEFALHRLEFFIELTLVIHGYDYG